MTLSDTRPGQHVGQWCGGRNWEAHGSPIALHWLWFWRHPGAVPKTPLVNRQLSCMARGFILGARAYGHTRYGGMELSGGRTVGVAVPSIADTSRTVYAAINRFSPR